MKIVGIREPLEQLSRNFSFSQDLEISRQHLLLRTVILVIK